MNHELAKLRCGICEGTRHIEYYGKLVECPVCQGSGNTSPLIEKEFLIRKVSGDLKIRLTVEEEKDAKGSYLSIQTTVSVDGIVLQNSESSFYIVTNKEEKCAETREE